MTSSAPSRRAALFDMDRTLLRVQTATSYVRYQREIGEASLLDLGRAAWWVLLYTLDILDAPRVAKRALESTRGMPETVLFARCDDWMRRDMLRYLSDEARSAVRMHQRNGDLVAIATGATLPSALPVARELGIEHIIATELEVRDGRLTGKAIEPLAYGDGKLKKAKYLLDQYGIHLQDTTFYSDSATDLPLLMAVGQPVAVNPDPKLSRMAKTRGWPIQRW
ncbi:MAG TPA: HAD-IB family hydrolase [Polyangiaceae bacterium]|jgi:HAD superfamily hydrolase (TIGR01490 family)|nr:MAG: Phosphoserine phosphatase [Deltaproteobacteria bacterium ADurb.Bin207]HNS97980.1 HAD-IB family hydrolase [Polyangiaceae bacterium]HNZ23636.1 HAD-IB family hydrolase [Polyangiaceae bacterium]HOD22448.1 HAD-IB family hydrolase [Polyangiaceae bacterium]HOE47781.1 HAD-IB family hydrolase [Polyangiaceae bacterium]